MKKRYLIYFILVAVFIGCLVGTIRSQATVSFSQSSTGMIVDIDKVDIDTSGTLDIAYSTDLTTSATLQTRTRTAVDGSPVLFTYPLRLADSPFFTGNQFTLSVTAFSGASSCTIRFAVKNITGVSVNIDITVTATGTYNIARGVSGAYITNCTSSQITAFSGIGKSITYSVIQSRYSAIEKRYDTSSKQTVYVFNSSELRIGNSVSANVIINNAVVKFISSGYWKNTNTKIPIYINSGSLSIKNSTIISTTTSASVTKFISYAGSLSVDNSFLISNSPLYISASTTVKKGYINHTKTHNISFELGNLKIHELYMYKGLSSAFVGSLFTSIYGLSVDTFTNGIELGTTDVFINNTNFVGLTYLCTCTVTPYDYIAIFLDCYSNTYDFDSAKRVEREKAIDIRYTVNLQIANNTYVNLSGVKCDFTDKNSVTLSKTTDTNGNIYLSLNMTRINDGGIYTFNPYIITCTKSDYQNINMKEWLSEKTVYRYNMLLDYNTQDAIYFVEHLYNCTGTHDYIWSEIDGYRIFNNYTGYSLILTILENLKNCTGTEQYYYNDTTGWKVYNNFTGFSILLTAIEDLINCTGTHASYYNSATGWKIYLNYTGNSSGGGSTVNRTINITINGHGFFNSWNGSINTSIQNISIVMNSDKNITGTFTDNDSFYEDKYFLEGVLSIESGLLFLGICLSLWIFFISKYLEHKDMTIAIVQFGLSIPTCIVVGVFAVSFSFGFVVVFIIPILSLSLIADSYYYRKNQKKK